VKQQTALVVLLALGVTGCRTAAPSGPRGFSDPVELLQPWVGRVLVLRHYGDEQSVSLRAGEQKSGTCDVIVRVGSVAFDKGTARLSLFTLGVPIVKGRRPRCDEPRSGLQLAFEGFGGAPERATLDARLGAVLQAPDAYLASKGVSFDLEAKEPSEPIATHGVDGPTAEVQLGRRVVSWPEPLLESEVWYRDTSGRVTHLGQVRVDAVVGEDGRLHQVQPRTSLAEGQRQALLGGLALWRFQPAATADGPVPARVALTRVLRIY